MIINVNIWKLWGNVSIKLKDIFVIQILKISTNMKKILRIPHLHLCIISQVILKD